MFILFILAINSCCLTIAVPCQWVVGALIDTLHALILTLIVFVFVHVHFQCTQQIAAQVLHFLSFVNIFCDASKIIGRYSGSLGHIYIGNWRAASADASMVGIFLVLLDSDVIHWSVCSQRESHQRHEKIHHWNRRNSCVTASLLFHVLFFGCNRLLGIRWRDWYWRHRHFCMAGKCQSISHIHEQKTNLFLLLCL